MNKLVLIVDPSRLVREAFAKIMLEVGIDKTAIACVETLNDAVEFAEISPIALIITGLEPFENSANFNQRLQVLNQLSSAPILVVDRQELSENKTELPASASYQILTKPLTEPRILSALYQLTQWPEFAQPEEITKATSKIKTSKTHLAQKATILVIDDESSNIDVAAGSLRENYRVIAAKSGAQALKLLAKPEQHVALILLDIMMPDMDGYQVCQQLNKHPETADIPVIFLSAKTQIDDIKKGFELGAVDYITKPLNPDLLRARVANHIRLKQHNQALKQQVITLKENAKLREDIEKITQHDLKGPLNTILFETHKLADKAVSQSINRAVNNVVDMINNSLNIYKIEQGIYPLTPQQVEPKEFITDAINANEQLITQKQLVLNYHGFDEPHTISAEPLLCISIINNLVKNAVEASPEQKSIELSLITQQEMLLFSITNQGVIPYNMRDTLFDKYSSSNHSVGTGLGTYSAQLMTKVQGGSLSFDIIDEHKTRFNLLMPLQSN